jgi:hypothetical protein
MRNVGIETYMPRVASFDVVPHNSITFWGWRVTRVGIFSEMSRREGSLWSRSALILFLNKNQIDQRIFRLSFRLAAALCSSTISCDKVYACVK